MKPKRILKEIDVEFISLVHKGANRKKIIYKSDNYHDNPLFDKVVEIKKVDDDKKLVYAIVYSPGEVDAHGDVADAQTIERAAYNFMRKGITKNVDKGHDYKADEGFVAESWITKENDSLFPDDPIGSWAVGIKVENEDTWQQIKKGEISGVSLAGLAKVEIIEKSVTQLNNSAVKHASNLIKRGNIIDSNKWSPPSVSIENSYIEDNGIEDFAKWHLGIDPDKDKDNKGAYGYIYTSDFENVDRAGLIAIRQRASQQGAEEIFNAAGKLIEQIDKKLEKADMSKIFKSAFNDLVELLKNIVGLNKDFNDELNNQVKQRIFETHLAALSSANWNVLYDSNIVDKKAALIENAKQFISAIENIDISKSISINKNEVEMTADEFKKTIDEALKSINDKIDALEKASKEKIESLEQINKELNERLEKVEKSTTGSQQQKEAPVRKEKQSAHISWLS